MTLPTSPADNAATTQTALDAENHPDPALLAPAPDEPRSIVTAPVDVRSASLAVLAVLASLYVLHWASAVFVPLLLGLTFSYALTPLVNRLVRMRLPRTMAAALLLVSIVSGVGTLAWALSDDAVSMVESLPSVAQKLRRGIAEQRDKGAGGTID